MVFGLTLFAVIVLVSLTILLIYMINVILSGITPLLALGLALLILYFIMKNSGMIKKLFG